MEARKHKTLIANALALALLPAIAVAQTVEYYHLDALGSLRAVTDENGGIVTRHDYEPFGEEWNEPPSNDTRRFTGMERDDETNLDYFGARYYGPALASFTTVDPAMTVVENLLDPQRWNRYAYARGNPTRYIDPTGRVVRLAALTGAQQQALLEDLNAFTGNTYDTNNAGELTRVSVGVDSSPIATDFIDQMIASQRTFAVVDARNPVRKNSDRFLTNLMFAQANRTTAGEIEFDFDDFGKLDYRGLDPRTFGLGSNLVHELAHFNGLEDPPSGSEHRSLGTAATFVNLIRAERGLPFRGPTYGAVRRFDLFGWFGTGGYRIPFEQKDVLFKQ